VKFIKSLVVFLLLVLLGALAFIFWPKIRECCDRWLAGQSCCGATADPDEVEAVIDAAPAVEQP
jgi:hypothetical protein